MRQKRTCKLCGTKLDTSLLKHKGNAIFHCKDVEACQSRVLSVNLVNEVINGQTMTKVATTPKLNTEARGYVITSVVSKTPLEPKVLKNLEYFCKHKDFELVIMSIDYKFTAGSEVEPTTCNPAIESYLLTDEVVLNGTVRLLGNLQLSPTAENPLTGLNPLTRGLTTVVPHTQLALESIATAPEERAIFLYSTGVITQPVYSDTKSGHKAKFHHSISAIVVEFDELNDFYIRTLPIDKDANIIDLGVRYAPNGNEKAVTTHFVLGDSHVGYTDTEDHRAVCQLVQDVSKKGTVVLHDVFDGSSINHHELDNPFVNQDSFFSLAEEYACVADYINSFAEEFQSVLIVDSNHHDFIAKWVLAADWKKLKDSPDNQREYLKAALEMSSGCTNLLKYAIEDLLHYSVKFLNSDSPTFIEGIDVSQHGHLGSGGAKGSAVTFNKLGYKTVTGHTHSARINKSNYTNGTSSELQLPYMKGLSSHSHTHTLIFEGGKRQMFTTYKGKYKP